MAAINGYEGSVTFAAGYTDSVHAWRIMDGGDMAIITPFAPPGNAVVRAAALGNWDGEYRCWKQSSISTGLTLAGGYYSTGAHSFTLSLTAEDLITTPFGANYNTRIAGLLSATGSYDCYLDDTTPLPSRGSSDTITLTVDAAETYVIPIIINTAEARVGAAGDDRHVTISWESRGEIVETGVPVVGVSGAAEFVAKGARKYNGNIVVLSVGISMTYAQEAAEYTIGFSGNGDPAGA